MCVVSALRVLWAAVAASAPPLHRAGRRYRSGWREVGWMPEEIVLSPRRSVEQPVQKPVSDLPEGSVSGRQTTLPWRDGQPFQTCRVRGSVQPGQTGRMGCLCKAPVRRPRTGFEVSGPLYAPRSDLEQPDSFGCRRQGDFSVEGLRRRQQNQNHDAGRSRVHPALSTSYPAWRFRAHPAVRISGEPRAAREACTLPHTAQRASTTVERNCRRRARSKDRRETMPGLQDRPHDSHPALPD